MGRTLPVLRTTVTLPAKQGCDPYADALRLTQPASDRAFSCRSNAGRERHEGSGPVFAFLPNRLLPAALRRWRARGPHGLRQHNPRWDSPRGGPWDALQRKRSPCSSLPGSRFLPTPGCPKRAEDFGSSLSPGTARCLRIGLEPTGAASGDAVPLSPMPTAST